MKIVMPLFRLELIPTDLLRRHPLLPEIKALSLVPCDEFGG